LAVRRMDMSNYGGYECHRFVAETYDLVPAYANRADTDFYLQYCKAAGRVLELGCGTGRVLLPAARAGVRTTGIDLSEYMLDILRRKLADEEASVAERVNLIQGNVTEFDLKERFELVIIPFRVLQHLLTVEEQIDCLTRVHRHLTDDGLLVFDVFQVNFDYLLGPQVGEEREDVPEYGLPDGRLLRRTGRVAEVHRAEQYSDVELIHYLTDRNGHTERLVQAFPMRWFFPFEMEHLLTRCGLRVRDLFGDFDGSPLRDDSPEMIFVADKTSPAATARSAVALMQGTASQVVIDLELERRGTDADFLNVLTLQRYPVIQKVLGENVSLHKEVVVPFEGIKGLGQRRWQLVNLGELLG
jgi:SAM-dependent methyltransferase